MSKRHCVRQSHSYYDFNFFFIQPFLEVTRKRVAADLSPRHKKDDDFFFQFFFCTVFGDENDERVLTLPVASCRREWVPTVLSLRTWQPRPSMVVAWRGCCQTSASPEAQGRGWRGYDLGSIRAKHPLSFHSKIDLIFQSKLPFCSFELKLQY